jgi:hypothetical protein
MLKITLIEDENEHIDILFDGKIVFQKLLDYRDYEFLLDELIKRKIITDYNIVSKDWTCGDGCCYEWWEELEVLANEKGYGDSLQIGDYDIYLICDALERFELIEYEIKEV